MERFGAEVVGLGVMGEFMSQSLPQADFEV